MRRCMLLEEHDPELFIIKGSDNTVADTLSRLDLLPHDEHPIKDTHCLEWLNLEQDELPEDSCPLRQSSPDQKQLV